MKNKNISLILEVKNYILIIVEKVVDTMQRKYVYIIAFLLAIIVSVSDYYVELSLNSVNVNELETTNNLEPNIFDENEFLDALDSYCKQNLKMYTLM